MICGARTGRGVVRNCLILALLVACGSSPEEVIRLREEGTDPIACTTTLSAPFTTCRDATNRIWICTNSNYPNCIKMSVIRIIWSLPPDPLLAEKPGVK